MANRSTSHVDLAQVHALHAEIKNCVRCKDDRLEIAKPSRMRRGNPCSSVMAIGIAPGRSAINANAAFAGNSLSRLLKWFEWAGYPLTEVHLRDLVYLTSLNKCAAIPDSLSKRKQLWRRCAPFLWRQINAIQPRLILILGKEPADLILGDGGSTWTDILGCTMTTSDIFAGDLFPPAPITTNWLFMPHPSGLSRTMNDAEVSDKVIAALRNSLKYIDFCQRGQI